MIVPSKYEEMLVEVNRIYELHQSFGLLLNTPRRLRVSQILESLLVFDKWCWITISDLTEVLEKSGSFQVLDPYVETIKNVVSQEMKSQRRLGARQIFLPAGQAIDGPTRLYEQLRVAFLVAASRGGSFANPRIAEVDTIRATEAGITFVSGEHGIVTTTSPLEDFVVNVSPQRIEPLSRELLFSVKLGESLFLEDTTNQEDAARYLFREYPRDVVETELLRNLADKDRYVRMNALTALGLPAYSVGFVPGADLPAKQVRLEPATLSVMAMQNLLDWAATEEDPGVLDYLICTLKTQNYEGRLRGISVAVAEVVRKIVPRLKDEQTIKDGKELLHELLE